MALRPYTVHLKEDAGDAGLVLVKDGFNWPAFFFAVPWALFHRMWWVAAALVVVQIALGVVFGYAAVGEVEQGLVSLFVALAIGYSADELRRDALQRKGYLSLEVVLARNTDTALARFLEDRPALAERLAEVR